MSNSADGEKKHITDIAKQREVIPSFLRKIQVEIQKMISMIEALLTDEEKPVMPA